MRVLAVVFLLVISSVSAQTYMGQNVNLFQEAPISFQTILDLKIDSVHFYEDHDSYKTDEKYFRINREQYKIFVSKIDKLLIREDNKENPLLYAYIKNARRNLIESGYHNVDVDLNSRVGLDTVVAYEGRLYLTIDTTFGYPKYNRYYYKKYKDQEGQIHHLLDRKITINKRPKDDIYPIDTIIRRFDYFISGGEKDTTSVELEDKVKPFLRSKIDKPHKKKLYFISVNFDGEDYGFEKYLQKLIKKNCKIFELQCLYKEKANHELPKYLKCYDSLQMNVVNDEMDLYYSIFLKNKGEVNFENYLILDHDFNVIYTFTDMSSVDIVYEDLEKLFEGY